jgi:hypothetical protein
MNTMIDYSDYETTLALPEASSMIETFRAIGYSIETAIADILDNSIAAKAKNIWIDFEWIGEKTWISIKDDGNGMEDCELINAMRPGSRNPNEERNAQDLGRFGLGLKSASFSQCRKLSVISKKNGKDISYWTWDLDYVNLVGKWEIIHYLPSETFLEKIEKLKSGTVVIWNDIDKITKGLNNNQPDSLDKFLEVMEHVKNHLAMVFHRFISSKKIKIWIQKREIEAWDPYLTGEDATQKFSEEPIQNGIIKVKGFVLPHKSKISEALFKKAEGPKGWNEQQGFYIYRNERLLLAGDWLGIFRKEEHYKLARIMIDLPNYLDSDWHIDIKKSTAKPPIILREQLKAYAMKVRAKAVEVFRFKGKVLQRKYSANDFQPVWQEKIRHGKRFYKINKEHLIIKKILSEFQKNSIEINELLNLIEETLPVPLITIKESEEPENHGLPYEGINHDALLKMIKLMFCSLKEQGNSDEEAKNYLFNIEPFNYFPEYIELL